MPESSPILVTGSTGFVGSALVRVLADTGHAVRCLVRPRSPRRDRLPADRVEIVEGDVADPETLGPACQGVGCVIHLVGLIAEGRGCSFESVVVAGTRHVLAAARAAGVPRCIYVSALGTSETAETRYHQAKWAAETAVRASDLRWSVLRPSVIIGAHDGWTTMLADLLRKPLCIPIPGDGQALVQPLYIGDLCQVFLRLLEQDQLWGREHDLGGPDRVTFEDYLDEVARQLGVQKPKLHVPLGVIRAFAGVSQTLLSRPPVTPDQLKVLSVPNVCDPHVLARDFGITPTLWREGLSEAVEALERAAQT